MPNVSLQPGPDNTSLDDLIAGVEKGILIYGDGSYSIDQQRYNFQFGGQVFWEIKNGKRGEMLRDVAYQSRTTTSGIRAMASADKRLTNSAAVSTMARVSQGSRML